MNFETIILNQKNVTNFSEARNRLLKNAKSEWVLFLDTDEKLSKELTEEITNIDPKEYNGFYIKRKIILLGKVIGEDKVLRLAKRNSGRWERKVHETWKIKGMVGILGNYIIHNTADSLSDYIGKINNYSSIHAKENLSEGKQSNLLKIVIYPKMKFIQNFFEGRGFVFSMLQSFHSFLGWVKQWELQKN
jgi:glycosyltransferase involved in cell wall biosynthesis